MTEKKLSKNVPTSDMLNSVFSVLGDIFIPNKWQVFILFITAVITISGFYFQTRQHELNIELSKSELEQKSSMMNSFTLQIKDANEFQIKKIKEDNAQLINILKQDKEKSKERNAQAIKVLDQKNKTIRENNAQALKLLKQENNSLIEKIKANNTQERQIAKTEHDNLYKHIKEINILTFNKLVQQYKNGRELLNKEFIEQQKKQMTENTRLHNEFQKSQEDNCNQLEIKIEEVLNTINSAKKIEELAHINKTLEERKSLLILIENKIKSHQTQLNKFKRNVDDKQNNEIKITSPETTPKQ